MNPKDLTKNWDRDQYDIVLRYAQGDYIPIILGFNDTEVYRGSRCKSPTIALQNATSALVHIQDYYEGAMAAERDLDEIRSQS